MDATKYHWTEAELAALSVDTQGTRLDIWGASQGTPPAPIFATLRALVSRAVDASNAGAFRVEIQLADGRWLYADEICQLHTRFRGE
jgi:hypothetical protein